MLNKPDKQKASKAKTTSIAYSSSISNINNNNSNSKQSSSRKESEVYYLIMEDDLAASPEYSGKLLSLIHRLMKKLPSDIDILYLKGIVPKSSHHLKASVLNKLFMEVNYVWTLKAYVLRASAVDTLLANLPITGPVGNFVAQLIYSRQLKV
jgi:GR25 family glycosyltransferase involved in LPS biosynthesis